MDPDSNLDLINSHTQNVHSIEKLSAPDAPVVLVNNAGVFENRRHESADGLEMTFAVNVAAPFLLTGLLLSTLQRRKKSRIVNVSSISQGAYAACFGGGGGGSLVGSEIKGEVSCLHYKIL